jgi:beta-glucosidase
MTVIAGRFVRTVCLLAIANTLTAQNSSIYHNDWIDFNKNGKKDVFEDRTKPVEARVKDIVSKMTIEEKTCQMATLYGYGRVLKDEMPTDAWKTAIWKDGIANIDEELNSVPFNKKAETKYSYPFSTHADAINTVQRWFVENTRMGIPVDFTNEGIHGLCHEKATPLPAPISIGATWNKNLVKRAGEIVGREAKALGYTNVYAPILDPARDQRWGRVVECYGEDPFLIAELGKQMVLGIQGQGVAATLKHFAVYSVPKGGRDGNARTDPHVAPKEMHQIYLYPFERVIREAKPLGVMSSYNDWDGEPVTGSAMFLKKLLRETYGFNGYVVSDSKAVEFLYSKHHVAKDFKEATLQSVNAGLNVWTNFNMPDEYINNVRALVKEGKISMNTIDERVSDVLRVKFLVGLFDQPYVNKENADKNVHTAVDEEFAKEINRQSLVLLKNKNALLPLNKNTLKNILVTGPLATAERYTTSRYGPGNNPVTSILKGIQDFAGNTITVDYAKGCEVKNAGWPETEILNTPLTTDENKMIADAVEKAKQADVVIAVVGGDETTVGESLSRTSLELPGRQQQFLEALHATGKPIVLVLVTGQPLTINWAEKNIPAILNAGFPGPSAGIVIAETLFGAYNPGGKLSMTYPKTTGQIELNFPFKPGSHASQSTTDDPNGSGKTSVNGPLYPFGYGLSYTNFDYSNLKVSPEKQNNKSNFTVTVDVTNTGKMKGDEVVQLYIKDKISSVTTYESQLRGFERVSLGAGEKKTVQFIVTPDHLSMLNAEMKKVVEPGEFDIMVGSSSVDIRQKKTISVD